MSAKFNNTAKILPTETTRNIELLDLAKFVSACSFEGLQAMSKFETLECTELQSTENRSPNETEVHYILIASNELHITLKILFDEAVAKRCLTNVFDKPLDRIPIQLARDFFKELCNLSAGLIQRRLHQDIPLWVSLPASKPIYEDAAFSSRKVGFSVPSFFWQVTTPAGVIKFSTDIVSYQDEGLPHIDFHKKLNQKEDESMFL